VAKTIYDVTAGARNHLQPCDGTDGTDTSTT